MTTQVLGVNRSRRRRAGTWVWPPPVSADAAVYRSESAAVRTLPATELMSVRSPA